MTSRRNDEQTGKMVTSTWDFKIYYMKVYYSNNNPDYPVWGVTSESDSVISINGEQNVNTFTVK